MDTLQIIQVIVGEHEYELLNVFPLVSPNTRLYHLLHDHNVQVGNELIFINGDDDRTVAIVSEIEYGDGTIWYRIVED